MAWPQPQAAALSRVFSEGHDANRAIQMSIVTWRFLWTEVVLKITTPKTTYKTSFLSFSVQIVGASTTM